MEEQGIFEVSEGEIMQSNDFDDELMFLYNNSPGGVDLPEWIDHMEHVPCPEILAESQTKPLKRQLEPKEDACKTPIKKNPEWQAETNFFEGPLSIVPPEWKPETKLSSHEIPTTNFVPKWLPATKVVPKIPDVKLQDYKCPVVKGNPLKTDSVVKAKHPALKTGYSCMCVECVGEIKTVDPKLSIPDSEILGTQCYLENTILGQCFKLYRLNGNTMKDDLRECVANSWIEMELDRVAKKHDVSPQEILENFTISTEKFVEMSGQIEDTFPGENKFAYFTSTPAGPKGYLWNEYCKKVELAKKKPESGLKQSREECILEPPHTQHPQPEFFLEPAVLIEPPAECILESPTQSTRLGNLGNLLDSEDIAWLHKTSKPYEEVVVRWQRSYSLRRKLFDQFYFTAQQYFDYFLCLQSEYAVDLLVYDFLTRYPNKSEAIKPRWDILKKTIALQLEDTQIKDAGSRHLASTFSTCSESEQDHRAMFFLPYFFKSRRPRNSVCRSPNNVEARREAFYLKVEDPSTFEETLEKVRKQRFEESILIQPLIVMVKILPENSKQFVLWNNMLITVPTCVEAIDLTFKITTALNLPFPELAKETWMFIKKCGYGINTSEHCNKVFNRFVDCFWELCCKF